MLLNTWEQKEAISKLLVKNFTFDELRTMCFDLRLKLRQYEDTPASIAKEICDRVFRRPQAEDLINYCIQKRPNIRWRKVLWELDTTNPYRVFMVQEAQRPQPAKKETSDALKIKLYNALNIKFSLNDLEELSFLLDIDWDTLEGKEKKSKIRALISYVAQRGSLENLVSKVRALRPDIDL